MNNPVNKLLIRYVKNLGKKILSGTLFPVIDKETKAVFGATAYALEEYFLSLASRYDIKKHQSKQVR
jgi:hypothetical protein